jgi:hypothetical protein
MDTVSDITTSLTGMPWYAAAFLILLSVLCTKGVDALLKLQRSRFEEQQYEDSEVKSAREALVQELKQRIEKLEQAISNMQAAYQAERISNSSMLAEERAAHAKCQLDREQLRGDLRVQHERLNTIQLQLDRLLKHDERNEENVKGLKEAVKHLDIEAATKLP